jgi:hypothetical protein
VKRGCTLHAANHTFLNKKIEPASIGRLVFTHELHRNFLELRVFE